MTNDDHTKRIAEIRAAIAAKRPNRKMLFTADDVAYLLGQLDEVQHELSAARNALAQITWEKPAYQDQGHKCTAQQRLQACVDRARALLQEIGGEP